MSTIELPIRPPSRPPGYLARQGYVKPLWQVKLRRSDVEPHLTYVPDDEAYNLPALKEKLESDKYSISTIDHVTVELTRTDELVDFLKGLKDPKRLRIKIFTYLTFRKWQRQLVWFGLLQNLPEGVDAYPWDKLKLTFMSPPGAWEDGGEVKDPDTGSAYRNKHVTDVLLPEFLKEARKQAKGGTREGNLEAPKVRSNDYFWSGLDRPRKKLAEGEGSRKYDSTYKVKALCWDTQRKLLYVGVCGRPDEYDKTPWVMSYDPVSRVWKKVATFTFPKGTGYDFLEKPTQWEILHLEYSGGKIYYVCQTTHPNLKRMQAHYKCYGEFSPGTVPKRLQLNSNNLFTLHNRGIVIRSRPTQFINNWPWGVDNYLTDVVAETIGFGTPRGEKEHGTLNCVDDEGEGYFLFRQGISVNSNKIIIKRYAPPVYQPCERDYVECYDLATKSRQSFGRITDVNRRHKECYILTVENKAMYDFSQATTITAVYKSGLPPSANVFIAKPQSVKVSYHFAEGFRSKAAATIYVEARNFEHGREEFYWPKCVGEVEETGEFYIDRVGYYSFLAFADIERAGEKYEKEYFRSGPVAPFEIELEGYNPAFLLADGFRVESVLQGHSRYGPYNQPGMCRVTRLQGGKWVTCRVGTDDLATYGDVFLSKDDSGIWAAWNDRGEDGYPGEFYARCRIAKWNETKKIFEERFRDRKGERWFDKPECYITSFVRYKGRCYGGRRHYEPNWIHTNLRFFFAAPPLEDDAWVGLPHGYDGGLVAICLLHVDRADVFDPGDIIRLGDAEEPGKPQSKSYYVSEVRTFCRRIHRNSPHLHDDWRKITGTTEQNFEGEVTVLALLGVRPPRAENYNEEVIKEMACRCISIKKGHDERHEIWEL
jgi:hypothetical protein